MYARLSGGFAVQMARSELCADAGRGKPRFGREHLRAPRLSVGAHDGALQPIAPWTTRADRHHCAVLIPRWMNISEAARPTIATINFGHLTFRVPTDHSTDGEPPPVAPMADAIAASESAGCNCGGVRARAMRTEGGPRSGLCSAAQ